MRRGQNEQKVWLDEKKVTRIQANVTINAFINELKREFIFFDTNHTTFIKKLKSNNNTKSDKTLAARSFVDPFRSIVSFESYDICLLYSSGPLTKNLFGTFAFRPRFFPFRRQFPLITSFLNYNEVTVMLHIYVCRSLCYTALSENCMARGSPRENMLTAN